MILLPCIVSLPISTRQTLATAFAATVISNGNGLAHVPLQRPLQRSIVTRPNFCTQSQFYGVQIEKSSQISCDTKCQMSIEQLNRREIIKIISNTLLSSGIAISGNIQDSFDMRHSDYAQFIGDGTGTRVYTIDSGYKGVIGEYIHPVHAIDFSNDEDGHLFPDTWDYQGHGEYCAYIIGSKEYGIAPQAEIVSLKVINKGGTSDWSRAKAFEFIEQEMLNNPHIKVVINMSISPDMSHCQYDPAKWIKYQENTAGFQKLKGSIERVLKLGAIVVKSAGNNGIDASLSDPVNNIPGVIVVGAVDPNGQIESFSNHGKSVSMFAPGSVPEYDFGVLGAQKTGRNIYGTSFAAPRVAGVAAALNVDNVAQVLQNNALDMKGEGLHGAKPRKLRQTQRK
eukprot:NODE_194_length_13294_cov_0.803714.p5 type:complete len:396 gc:universal NODE_194_length_13294_cov_0.803714:11399-12586(+)